jgi:MFS family permease
LKTAAERAERQPLLTDSSKSSQVQPGLDEANNFLFFSAVLASIGMGLQSFNGNFTAVSLAADCTAPGTSAALNCQLKISDQLVSVYAAIPAIASIPGAFVGGAFVDRVGRKRMMVLACVPFVAGWALTALAPTPTTDSTHQIGNSTHRIDHNDHATLSSRTVLLLFAGRVLLGFGGGLSIPGIGPWITESAPPHLRGAFATLFQVR